MAALEHAATAELDSEEPPGPDPGPGPDPEPEPGPGLGTLRRRITCAPAACQCDSLDLLSDPHDNTTPRLSRRPYDATSRKCTLALSH